MRRSRIDKNKVSVSLSFLEWLEIENALYRGIESFRKDKLDSTATSAKSLLREMDTQLFEQNEMLEVENEIKVW